MKANIIIALFLGLFLASCNTEIIKPQEEVTTQTYDLKDFTEIEAQDAFQVYVTFSETEDKVAIESNSNFHEKMIIEKIGDRLMLRFENALLIDNDHTVINAYITTSNIDVFEGSGASAFFLQNDLEADNKVAIDLSGASNFEGTVFATELKASLSGASKINLIGSAKTLKSNLSGASTIEDLDFSCEHLVADLSGASKLKLNVDKSLVVTASGASEIIYQGAGSIISQELSGASSINKR